MSHEPSRPGSVVRPFQPAGRAGLLEVGAHDDEQAVLVLPGRPGEPAGVVAGGLRVVERARAGDDQEPVVGPVEDGAGLAPPAVDGCLPAGAQRLVVAQRGGRRDRGAVGARPPGRDLAAGRGAAVPAGPGELREKL